MSIVERTHLAPGTAVVVVDVQNDFADPGGALYVPGGEKIIPAVNHLVAQAVERGAAVVYTQDWHPPQTPHFAQYGGVWPVHCVMGTWGAELHPALDVVGPVLRKNGAGAYSGFNALDQSAPADEPRDLNAWLRADGVGTLVVVGLAADYCVKQTALDALRLGYRTIVPRELTRAVERVPGDGARAFAEVLAAGGELA